MQVKYFAYASNLDATVMARTCPSHRYLGVARLDDYRLAYTRRSIRTGSGVADIVPRTGAAVWGALYDISVHDLAALDRKEGAGWAYERFAHRVWLPGDASWHEAFTYVVLEKEPAELAPSAQYIALVLAAATARGLPSDYIARIVGHARATQRR